MKKNYKWDNVGKVLSFAVMECLLCENFYRTKGALRTHLSREHTKLEIEIFLESNE